jgi:hypothetical protein
MCDVCVDWLGVWCVAMRQVVLAPSRAAGARAAGCAGESVTTSRRADVLLWCARGLYCSYRQHLLTANVCPVAHRVLSCRVASCPVVQAVLRFLRRQMLIVETGQAFAEFLRAGAHVMRIIEVRDCTCSAASVALVSSHEYFSLHDHSRSLRE